MSMGNDPAQPELIWLVESGYQYHWPHPSESDKTACGINHGKRETRRLTDPGDALDPCEECRFRTGESTIDELVHWLADESRADFEVQYDSPPSYLSKEQLVALRNYILELEDSG